MPLDTIAPADRSLLDDSLAPGRSVTEPVWGLVILWSRSSPERIGEVFLFPPRRGGWVLGRAHPEDDRAGIAKPVRQRPGDCQPGPALESRRISRRQLALRPLSTGLHIENVGAAELRVNGERVDQAEVQVDDLVSLHRELVLLCVSRPAELPAVPAALSGHPFGAPDAFGIVGESPSCWRLRAQLALVAQTTGHVLLQGPSGAGKELAARAIHRQSGDAGLVSRNAATFPEGLIDAELFGNASNYPNPGMRARTGAVGEADGGILFLDEIGEISHAVQAHLLRVLDSGEYQRLGEDRRRRASFRMIGATNRPPEALKHDFLARLSRRVTLPGLNARREDIPLLARHLLRAMAADNPALFPSGAPPRLHPRLVSALARHHYTTHARELNNLLWQAAERWRLDGGTEKYMDFPLAAPAPPPSRRQVDPDSLTREQIVDAYRECGGVQARVVEHLGLKNRFALGRLEKRLGITAEDRSGG